MMNALVNILAYTDQTMQQANTGSMIVSLIFAIIGIAANWMIFTKAGEAGWKAIIPILNLYVLFKIVYGNGLKFLLLFVPILNIILAFAYCIRLAQVFGKGTGFGVGLIFLGPIFEIILAFGDASYQGPYHGFL